MSTRCTMTCAAFRSTAASLAAPVLAVGLLSAAAHAQWSDDPALNLPVAVKSDNQAQPKIHATSDGGAYISWFDNADGGYDAYLQRLDADGNPLWDADGLLIADRSFSSTQDYDLDVDGDDHALLTFRDDRFGGVRITATRVSPDGVQVWGDDGVQLTDGSGFVAAPKIAATSDGAIVVAWTNDSDGRLQRLTADGEPAWRSETAISGGGSFSVSDLNASDDGSVIVSLVLGFGGQLHAQKVDADGNALWTQPTVQVQTAGGLQFGNFPTFVTDGDGGAVFAWYTNGPLQCWTQRLDADGDKVFGPDAVPVSTNAAQIRVAPSLDFNPTTQETFIFWTEQNALQSQFGVYGQKLDAAGARQWTDSGLPLVPLGSADLRPVRTLAFGDGAMVYWVRTDAVDDQAIFGRRVDSAGGDIWSSPIVTISDAASGKANLTATLNSSGQALLAWSDSRNDFNDIYAQNVNADGTLGVNEATPGDLDDDGEVGVGDLLILLGAWGDCSDTNDCPADLDGDRTVGVGDLLALLSAWSA